MEVEAEAEQDFTGILQWVGEGRHLLEVRHSPNQIFLLKPKFIMKYCQVTASALLVEPWPTSCARRARGFTTAAPSVRCRPLSYCLLLYDHRHLLCKSCSLLQHPVSGADLYHYAVILYLNLFSSSYCSLQCRTQYQRPGSY